MSKLKRIIQQLEEEEVRIIHKSLVRSEAMKSADLLTYFREGKLSDAEIKQILEVNNNAFYTLRSRLNDKIEEFILERTESPKNTLLVQVAGINDIMLSKSKLISIATLKKMEKDLLHYDLSSELTQVYKALKKLYIHHDDYFYYSQQYNKHVAYTLSIDKAEDLLAQYFNIYAFNAISYEPNNDVRLELIENELANIAELYQSHRLTVYHNCCQIFSKIQHTTPPELIGQFEWFNERFAESQHVFDTYRLDTVYHNLKWVFRYLRLLYNYKIGVTSNIDDLVKEITPVSGLLICNYNVYTSPLLFLHIKMSRAIEKKRIPALVKEFEENYETYELDPLNVPIYFGYSIYKALAYYHNGQYLRATEVLNQAMDAMDLKQYLVSHLDAKLLLATFYLSADMHDDAIYMLNNVQRYIRINGRDMCVHTHAYLKVLRSYYSNIEPEKRAKKIEKYLKEYISTEKPISSPLYHVKLDLYTKEISTFTDQNS